MPFKRMAAAACPAILSSLPIGLMSGRCGSPTDRMKSTRARSHVPNSPSIGTKEGERPRSEEHTSELQSLMRISYAVFCLKKKNKERNHDRVIHDNTEKHKE